MLLLALANRHTRQHSQSRAFYSKNNRSAFDEVVDQRTNSAKEGTTNGCCSGGVETLLDSVVAVGIREGFDYGADARANQKPIQHRIAPPRDLPDFRRARTAVKDGTLVGRIRRCRTIGERCLSFANDLNPRHNFGKRPGSHKAFRRPKRPHRSRGLDTLHLAGARDWACRCSVDGIEVTT